MVIVISVVVVVVVTIAYDTRPRIRVTPYCQPMLYVRVYAICACPVNTYYYKDGVLLCHHHSFLSEAQMSIYSTVYAVYCTYVHTFEWREKKWIAFTVTRSRVR